MKLRSPLNNPLQAVVLVCVLVLGWALMRGCEAEAAEPNSETITGLGVGFVSNDFSESTMVLLSERFYGKWELGLGLISDQTSSRGDIRNNAVVRAARVVSWRGLELSLGAAYWANTNAAVTQNLSFDLGAAWVLRDRHRLFIAHWSNGGQQERNPGQNVAGYSYAF